MRSLKVYIITLFLAINGLVVAQQQNYLGINLQSQLSDFNTGSINLQYLLLDYSNDTVWHEEHVGLNLSNDKTLISILGKGNYLGGSQINFDDIDWRFVAKLKIYKLESSTLLIGEYMLNTVPFALHSLHLDSVPIVLSLTDVQGTVSNGSVLKYNSSNFTFGQDLIYDSTLFAYQSGLTAYSDTALVGISNITNVDTVIYGFLSDTANFSAQLNTSINSDSSIYTDTSAYAFYTLNAWQIDGNNGNILTLGSSNLVDFGFQTNGNKRLNFSNTSINNYLSTGIGKNFQTMNGVVHKFNGIDPNVVSISDAYLFFNGSKSAFSGGTSFLNHDTLMGNYSFCWGMNVGTNGPNSTVFGKNSSGDSSLFGGATMYPSISSFAFGNNCHVAHMSVAIGYNSNATYYRNVAIGRNVTASNQSASVAIGDNVLAVGATSWGMGQNIEATGHFSTAMGTNASTNYMNGSFVYGDFSTTDTVKNSANQQFMVRAEGGVIIYSSTDLLMGVSVASGGGSWNMVSDMNKKHSISKISPQIGEDWFKDIEVYQWRYKKQNTIHIGPMAQDMYSVFQVGESNRYINQLDIDGAVIYGVKLLSNKLDKELILEKDIETLKSDLELENAKTDDIEERINKLYEEMDH